MGTKTAKAAGKSAGKSKPASNRGGARPGAGRKPKAVAEMQLRLNTEFVKVGDLAPIVLTEAAELAFRVLKSIMEDDAAPKGARILAAKEVLSRALGRYRDADEPGDEDGDTEQVHIYMPDNARDAREAV